ncbi:hypothetical protein [Roseobacter sp. HKCCA0434]|uniref:hypothetical protein n=1 Tax=Roseobacter sp. HKCCA0434 TaxID=3079297 RepID=UPI002905A3D9|nr:hypothetical protein [Roseobacter sp. HKCCA0434]
MSGTSTALSDTDGLFFPSAPRGSGGSDSFQSASGARCSQSINSSGSYLDIGLTASDDTRRDSLLIDDRDRGSTVYARVVIPLGQRPQRLDCIRLYEMELERMRLELELMRMGAQ